MTVSVFATINPKTEHVSDARAAIMEILAVTLTEEGCIRFELHENVETGQLHIYEVWASHNAFEAHHAQPYTKAVYVKYEDWLAAPVQLTWMRPVDLPQPLHGP